MTEIVVDAKTCQQLENLDDYVQFRDAAGRLLGYFTPTRLMYEGVDSPLSPEELKLRESEPGREWPTILADLENLAKHP